MAAMKVADKWLCSSGSSLNWVSAGGGRAVVVFGESDELGRELSIIPTNVRQGSYSACSIVYY